MPYGDAFYEKKNTTNKESGKGRLTKKEIEILKYHGMPVVDPDNGS